MIHSVDAYVLREIIRRTNYDKEWIEVLRTMKPKRLWEESKETRMVKILLEQYEKTGLISQKISDYIRPYNISLISPELLNLVLNRFAPKPFQTLTIHDCFRVHANYCNELRKQYINILAELAESNLLNALCWQINKFRPNFTKVRGIGKLIRDTAEYPLS